MCPKNFFFLLWSILPVIVLQHLELPKTIYEDFLVHFNSCHIIEYVRFNIISWGCWQVGLPSLTQWRWSVPELPLQFNILLKIWYYKGAKKDFSLLEPDDMPSKYQVYRGFVSKMATTNNKLQELPVKIDYTKWKTSINKNYQEYRGSVSKLTTPNRIQGITFLDSQHWIKDKYCQLTYWLVPLSIHTNNQC